MKNWYCKNFNFDINKVDGQWSSKHDYKNCLIYSYLYTDKWDDFICETAIVNNNINSLIFSHENGCQLNDFVLEIAARKGYLECLKYVFKHKKEYNKKRLLKYSHPACYNYILKNF